MIVSQVNLKPLSTRAILLKMTCYEFESDFRRIMMIFLVINDLQLRVTDPLE